MPKVPGVQAAESPAPEDPVFPTKTLPKFLACLRARQSPILIDLGPVIPSNVSFFGEQLGCKVYVEDVCAEVERHVGRGRRDGLAEFLGTRFSRPAESVDAVLCWDVLDYLEKPAAQALAVQLMRLLRPDGALLGFFSNVREGDARHTKYVVADAANLRYRSYGPVCGRQAIWSNRDIILLFADLRVSDSFLLKNNQREILFRKPA